MRAQKFRYFSKLVESVSNKISLLVVIMRSESRYEPRRGQLTYSISQLPHTATCLTPLCRAQHNYLRLDL